MKYCAVSSAGIAFVGDTKREVLNQCVEIDLSDRVLKIRFSKSNAVTPHTYFSYGNSFDDDDMYKDALQTAWAKLPRHGFTVFESVR